MQNDKFYITEQEWGQITIVPEENEKDIVETLKEPINTNIHVSWDDIHFRKYPSHPIKNKNISLDDLLSILPINTKNIGKACCQHHNDIEEISNTFSLNVEDYITFYGKTDENIITELSIDLNYSEKLPSKNLIKSLNRLGQNYNLVLIDWLHELIIHLKDNERVKLYFSKINDIYSE